MRDEAYDRLRRLIEEGTLGPAERLRDEEIAGWLGVSRTPVREALARLVDDGLVETAANRFTRVTDLRPADAAEGYPVLAQLEALAAADAAAIATPQTLERLREASDRFTWSVWREDGAEARTAEADFHATLVAASPNLQLRSMIVRLQPRLRRLEQHAWPAIAGQWPAQHHAALIEAISLGSPTDAASASAGEWRAVGELVGRALVEAGQASAERVGR